MMSLCCPPARLASWDLCVLGVTVAGDTMHAEFVLMSQCRHHAHCTCRLTVCYSDNGIEKYIENSLKLIELHIKPIKMDGEWLGNGWDYPTYVLGSGAFLAGAFFFLKSLPLFIKSTFLAVFIIKLL